MNRDYGIDLSEVMRSIASSEVVSILFPRLRRSLIIDTRFTLEDMPMIKVVPMVASFEDRLRSLKRMRPTFPRPSDVAVIPWFGYVDSLNRLGIWDLIMQRLVDSAHKDAVKECSETIRELKAIEREEMAAVIRGDGYQTIWSNSRR